MNTIFKYEEAFKRNIGLISPEEQRQLKSCTVALTGLGGVGGSHLIHLVRMGFERFHISDFDDFDLGNFNRQHGSGLSTLGKEKAIVLKSLALDINPNCQILVFDRGIDESNVDQFLSGVDIVIDTIDVFVQKMRRYIFNKAYEKNIPMLSAGPMGFGTGYFSIIPHKMNYDEYFNINDVTLEEDMLILFLIGLSPSLLHVKYLLKEYIDMPNKIVPSSSVGIAMASGVAVAETVKIILKRGPIKPLPYTHQFDAFSYKHRVNRLFFGNRSLIQKIKFKVAKKRFAK